MRKSIFCLTLLLGGFILSGCSKEMTDLSGKEKSLFEINEDAIYKDINYRITKVDYLYEDGYGYELKDKENNVILAITFEIENNSKNKYSVATVEPSLTVDDKDINSYTYVREPEDISNNAYFISPSETFQETDYFEISNNYEDIEYKLIIDKNEKTKKDIEMNVKIK